MDCTYLQIIVTMAYMEQFTFTYMAFFIIIEGASISWQDGINDWFMIEMNCNMCIYI